MPVCLWENASLWTGLGADTGSASEAETIKAGWAVLSNLDGKIAWIGPTNEAPHSKADQVFDCEGRLITPGLIDCHTHLIYAGDRAGEWRLRLEGATYEAIARAGGGILSTVAAVRGASEDSLMQQSLPRLQALMADGVTTVEVKSGYGLTREGEEKMLRVATRLSEICPVTVRRTYLGAHAVPPEACDGRSYIAQIKQRDLPYLVQQELVDAVDGFCEKIAFGPDEIESLFETATALHLPVKLHAEQLSNQGGAALAARFNALSVDHLEYLDEEGVAEIARSGTVAVLLPGAFYFLRERKVPPIELLRSSDVPMAVATDCNPGSSPLFSIRTALNMACTLFGLTPTEALLGATRHAARALGLQESKGVLATGMDCDLAIWDAASIEDLFYAIGGRPLWQRVWMGQ